MVVKSVNRGGWLLLALALLLLPLTAAAQGGASSRPAPIILTEGQEKYPVGRHLELLADPTGELTIEAVSSPAYNPQFSPSQAEVPNFGSTPAAIWARFQVHNEAGPATTWRLAVAEARLAYVDLYAPAPDGTGWIHHQAGRARPFTVREIPYRYGVFKLPLPPGQTQAVYLRVQGGSLLLPLTLWSLEAFSHHAQTNLLIFGLFYGVMLVMLGYNLFLFASLHDHSYLYLTLLIANFGLNDAFREGLAQQYLWPAWPNLYGIGITATLNFILALLFGASFLQTKIRTPRLHKAMVATMLIAPLYYVLVLAGWAPGIGGSILPLLIILLLVAASYMAWRQGHRPARYFLLAWLIFLGGAFFHNLTNTGLLPGTPFGQQSMRIGMALMVLLLSLALADRVNLLKMETDQANLALKDSEHRLNQFLEAMPVGVAVYDRLGRLTYTNRYALRLLNLSPEPAAPNGSAPTLEEAIVQLAPSVAGSEEPYPRQRMPVTRALQGEAATVDDIEIDRPDGPKQLEVWSSPIFDGRQGLQFAVAAFRDITRRKLMEKRLRASETRFRTTFEQAAVGIAHVAPDGTFLRLNQKFCDIVGYSHDEMLAQTFQEITHPDDLDRDLEQMRQLLAGEIEWYAIEKRYFRKDGQVVWVNLTTSLVRKETGEPDYFVAVIEEITRRRQAEEALWERKERYRLALEIGQIALWQVDVATDRWELDGAVEQITGYEAEEIETGADWAKVTYPEDLPRIGQAWQPILEGRQEQYEIVHRILRKDGSVRWVEAHGTSVRAEHGQVIRILGTSRDITATRRAEALVADQTAELVEANQTLQQEVSRRRQVETALRQAQDQLEQRVAARTAELAEANRHLERLLDTLEQRVADRTRELTAFLDLTMLVSEARSLPDILEAALDRMMEVGQCQTICLHLPDEAHTCLELVAQRGLAVDHQQQVHCLPLEGPLARWLIQRHEPVLEVNLALSPLPATLKLAGFHSYVGTQLRTRQQMHGLVSYYRHTGPHFSLDEISLLAALTKQMSIVIENHRLRGRIEEMAVVTERQRLAQDLHDSINQSLYSLNLFAHAGRQAVEDGDLDRLQDNLVQVETLTQAVLKEMRLLLYQLQPLDLTGQSLAEALQRRFDAVERRLGIEVAYQVEGRLAPPKPVVEPFYRAAQEVLNNALKHAGAGRVEVCLTLTAQTVRLEVTDNGRGFDPAQVKGGMGLKSIRQRMAQIGGRVEISSAPGHGTRVVLAVDPGITEER